MVAYPFEMTTLEMLYLFDSSMLKIMDLILCGKAASLWLCSGRQKKFLFCFVFFAI